MLRYYGYSIEALASGASVHLAFHNSEQTSAPNKMSKAHPLCNRNYFIFEVHFPIFSLQRVQQLAESWQDKIILISLSKGNQFIPQNPIITTFVF